jgi:hypothetical protein
VQEDGEEEEAGAELEARLQAAASEAEEGMTETDLPRESAPTPSNIPNPLRALGGQPLKRVRHKIIGGIFFWIFFFILYSTLLHLPPLRFHCADECWDRTQDRCNCCIGSQTLETLG